MSTNDIHSDYTVYNGFWVNRGLGLVKGATITLDRQRGAILIAFLALFVGLAGSGCWNIVRFLLHRIFSSNHHTDGIYHQRQAILRNSGTAHSAAWELLRVSVAWRGSRAKRNAARLLPVIVLSLVLSAAFTAAGILSSHVTLASSLDLVLVSDVRCASRVISDTDSRAAFENNIYQFKKATEYLAYALQCYQTSSTVGRCQTYVHATLPHTTVNNAPCPFDQALCKTNSSNLVMDTGYLESARHLGINGGPNFSIRQTRQCAPLVSKGYKKTETDATTGKTYVRYYYHASENSTSSQPDLDADTPTWEVPPYNISREGRLDSADFQSLTGYRYGVVSERPLNSTTPLLPALTYPEAQISLIFLEASAVMYSMLTGPVTDPWFSATTPLSTYIAVEDGEDSFYVPDEPASAVACATTTYVCNPRLPAESRCVTTFHKPTFRESLALLWTNDNDRAGVQGSIGFLFDERIFNADSFYNIANLPTLQSQFSLTQPVYQDAMPSDQWQKEMVYVFQAGLASLQAAVVETATGDLLWPEFQGGNVEPYCTPTTACKAVCERQMIRSTGHLSFQVLAVLLIICIGSAFIVVGFGIEYIALAFDWVRNLGNHGHSPAAYAEAEWQASSPLQLQRLANEALGLGAWSGSDGAVPVTEAGDALGVLDVKDKKHPRLVHPSAYSSAISTGYLQDEEKQPVAMVRPVTTRADTWTDREPSDHDSFLSGNEGARDGIIKIGSKM